jgi:hypothetical protein
VTPTYRTRGRCTTTPRRASAWRTVHPPLYQQLEADYLWTRPRLLPVGTPTLGGPSIGERYAPGERHAPTSATTCGNAHAGRAQQRGTTCPSPTTLRTTLGTTLRSDHTILGLRYACSTSRHAWNLAGTTLRPITTPHEPYDMPLVLSLHSPTASTRFLSSPWPRHPSSALGGLRVRLARSLRHSRQADR